MTTLSIDLVSLELALGNHVTIVFLGGFGFIFGGGCVCMIYEVRFMKVCR